jgi:hypothetical protein
MNTSISHGPEHSLFQTVIMPAILRVLNDGQGNYRCERDLHHHFTVCLDWIRPVQLGSRKAILQTERPAVACYGSGRQGNIDFFVAAESHGMGPGVALEVKVKKDLCKLIDPKNAYAEAVYFAYGRHADFLNTVQEGLQRAFTTFTEADPGFLLPAGLRIVVAVRPRHREMITNCTYVDTQRMPSQLSWSEWRVANDSEENVATTDWIRESTTNLEDKMNDYKNPERDHSVDGRHSYQTAPLSAYSGENQRFAAELCETIGALGARTIRYKGSYSVFRRSSLETIAKIVIYEDGKGKSNGALHLRPGVYGLIRANGTAGEQNRVNLAARGLLTALPNSDTIGVAPAHGERFHYLRVDETNIQQCLEMFRACASA